MEDLPTVSYSTGTMNSLLDKLANMENHSNATEEFADLTQKFKKAVLSLKEDFFDKLAVPNVCMKQVRELVFEIEDWIDQKRETNTLHPSDIEEIRNFMTEMEEARARFTWYYYAHNIKPTEPDLAVVAPSKITINPRLLEEEKFCHGVLDGPRDELVKHLTDKEEMRKVVSLVGIEGLGKTTLAKEIYSELQLRRVFECQAFVTAGRRTSVRKILVDILRQLKPQSEMLRRMYLQSQAVDMQEIISELREYLVTKRYFILVNGIWSTWAWKVINCCLPDNRGSRVLATTCIMDVGRSCCSYPNDLVCQMEALNKKNSRILFLSKTITLQEEVWAGFDEDSCYMLKMCGGMPLALSVAAGLLLARKSRKLAELKMFGESVYSSPKQYSFSEGMTKILHMSYADLSLPLRSCFLYLSFVPENYTIKKDLLMLLWGAEGFIPRLDNECLWVTGERYFNELISRRLIQPVFDFDDDQAVGCTVHTVILDFIRSLSREENFATRATELSSSPFPCDTIRRFSVDRGNKDEVLHLSTSIVHLSSMRSLSVFGEFVLDYDEAMFAAPALRASLDALWAFKFLRVLYLEGAYNYLPGIGGLVLLRYLGLAGTGIQHLPYGMENLEQLETLHLKRMNLSRLPTSGDKLQKLRHLLLELNATQIWEMPELEELSEIYVENRSSLDKVVELLRRSERLRMLGIHLKAANVAETDLISFLDEVVKSNLQSLSVRCDYNGDEWIPRLVNSWEKVTASLVKKFEPQRFELKISLDLQPVPPNMGSLSSLTHLRIKIGAVRIEDFLVLGGLSNLVLLNLISYDYYSRGRFIIKKGIFPCLKVFSFQDQNCWTRLEFEQGAMPQLQRLRRSFEGIELWERDFIYPDIGVEHLTCLTRVRVIIYCCDLTDLEVEAMEADIRGQISKIDTKPTLELVRAKGRSLRRVQRRELSHVSPSRRQEYGETSIQLQEEDDQIMEDYDQTMEDEDQMWKDKGKHSVPSKKQVFENIKKRVQLQRSISSLAKKMKDKLIGRPKVTVHSKKHKLKSSIEEEDSLFLRQNKNSPSRNRSHSLTEEQSI